jgi:hypothetical protein
MRVICCICKLEVGTKEGEGDSHTICPACMPVYLRQQGLALDEAKKLRDKKV